MDITEELEDRLARQPPMTNGEQAAILYQYLYLMLDEDRNRIAAPEKAMPSKETQFLTLAHRRQAELHPEGKIQ